MAPAREPDSQQAINRMPENPPSNPFASELYFQEGTLTDSSLTLAHIALGQEMAQPAPRVLLSDVGAEHSRLFRDAPRDLCVLVGALTRHEIQVGQLSTFDAWGLLAHAARNQTRITPRQAQALLRFRGVPPAATVRAARVPTHELHRATQMLVSDVEAQADLQSQLSFKVPKLLRPPGPPNTRAAGLRPDHLYLVSACLFGQSQLETAMCDAAPWQQATVLSALISRHLARPLPRNQTKLNRLVPAIQLGNFCQGRDVGASIRYEASLDVAARIEEFVKYLRFSLTLTDRKAIKQFVQEETPDITLGSSAIWRTPEQVALAHTPRMMWDITRIGQQQWSPKHGL